MIGTRQYESCTVGRVRRGRSTHFGETEFRSSGYQFRDG